MSRKTYADFLTSTGEEVPELLRCRCSRVIPATNLYDAREYEDVEGDWRCSICLSAKDREQALAAEIAAMPAPSWSPTCEKGNWARAERQRLLTACDWTQMADVPLSEFQKGEWAAYRAALRDITEAFADPTAVTWPTPPA